MNEVYSEESRTMFSKRAAFDKNVLSNHISNATRLLAGSTLTLTTLVGAAQAAGDEAFVLEEIVVTAEKRGATSIMDTSFSISAVTGEALEERGVTSVIDALKQNPGVSSYSLSGTANYVQIRGVSSVVGDATIGYYLDDIPFSLVGVTSVPDVNPYDLERLEVLRGPQGTLYGAGSLGGTVRILTKAPEHNEFSAKGTLGVSSTKGGDDGWKAQVAVNIPLLEDVLSARIVASSNETGGYIDLPLAAENNHNDSTDDSYRAKLRWTPTEDLSVDLSYWHSNQEAGLGYGEDDYSWSPVYLEFDALTNTPVGARAVTGNDLRNESTLDMYSLRIEYDFGDYSIYSATSKLETDQASDINYLGVPFGVPIEAETFNQELRLSYHGDGTLSWTAGLFYMDAETDIDAVTGLFFEQTSLDTLNAILALSSLPPLANPTLATISEEKSVSEQWAIFGETKYQLSDTLAITVGARYFEDQRETEEFEPALAAGLEALAIGAKREADFSKATGRLNLAWTPDEDSLYYLNVAQGFRSGTATPGPTLAQAAAVGINFDPITDEENLTSFELGSKLTLLDGTLLLDLAAYYFDWQDIIVTTSIAGPGGVPYAARLNVGEADALGLDLGLTYGGIDGLTLQLTGNFNESEYAEDLPGAGISDGDAVTFVPELTYSASAEYRWAVGGTGMEASIFGIYTYTDERTDYAIGLPPYVSDDFGVLNLRMGLETEQWSLYLSGQNLLDEDTGISQLALSDASGTPPNRLRPQTVALEFTFNL